MPGRIVGRWDGHGRRGDAARAQIGGRRSRGQHVQHRIDLHGVGIDDAPPSARAISMAKADLPLAVGPAIRIAFLIGPRPRPTGFCPCRSSPRLSPIPPARILHAPLVRIWPRRPSAQAAIALARARIRLRPASARTGRWHRTTDARLARLPCRDPVDIVVQDSTVGRARRS